MRKYLQIAITMLVFPAFVFAQNPVIGTPEWLAAHNSTERNSDPVYTPQNGNDTLNSVYNNTACGLNYAMVTQRLGQRFYPLGIPQPAPFNIVMPPCAVIQQAFLYTEVLGVAPSVTANLTNPSNVSSVYNMTNIGNSVDVCWGMGGTHVWRTDVTASINGPGTYMVSGLPISTNISTTTTDCEGATLLIIYTDPSATYTGTLSIDDGCHTVTSGVLTHTMTGFNACANSTFAKDFMLIGDMQMPGYTLMMNGSSVPQPQWDWWNEISANTSVSNGQNSCNYLIADGSDCFTLAVAGLYFQTGCSTCTPVTTTMTLSTTAVADNCNGNGSASVTASGGSGNYTYLWIPTGDTTANPTNLTAGTYTVYVNDGTSCAAATAVVSYTGMNLTMSSTNVTCLGQGSASVSVTGGQGPYTYLWSPGGGTTATITSLSAGTYVCAVTDNNGCTMMDSTVVTVTGTLAGSISTTSDSCGMGVGTAQISAWNGTAPYTYLWAPGGQTTSTITGTAGTYTCTITDSLGCTVAVVNSIGNASLTVTTSGPSSFTCADSSFIYVFCNANTATYSWSPATFLDNPNSPNPICTPTATITYTVTATAGCLSATDTFTVYVDTTNTYNEPICFVTVDTALNKNVVIWERTNSPAAGAYNIYRETSVSGVYAIVGTQPISQFTTFTDATSNPSAGPDRYVITTVDVCGNESDTSYHHRTIFLTTTANGPGWDLNWTAYEGLPIAIYNIYRGSSPSTMSLLTSVAGNILTYTDASPPVGQNLYMIEAVHPFGGCNPSRYSNPNALANDGSYSNIGNWNPTGISGNDVLQNSMLITPNPNNGNFTLTMTVGNAQKISVTVFDHLGQNVYAKQENASAGNVAVAMDLSSLSSGIYFVQVTTANGIATKRLVIQ